MKNKIELKKMLSISIVTIIIWAVILGIFEIYEYKIYTKNVNQKIAQIITKICEEYKDIDKNELMLILNNKENIDTELFNKYGIDLNAERYNLTK